MLKFPSMTMFEGRAALQRYIVDEAQRLAPDSIKFHFSQSIAQLDLARRTLRLVPLAAGSSSDSSSKTSNGSGAAAAGVGSGVSSGRSSGSGSSSAGKAGDGSGAAAEAGGSKSSAASAGSVQYDLLVGADGANSCVRAALTEQVAEADRYSDPICCVVEAHHLIASRC
jgi:hypothetical protein